MHDLRRVVLWMAGALMSFSALAVAIREMARVITVWEVLALRNLGGIIVLGTFALLSRTRIGPPAPLRIHLLRNIFHFAGQACWAFGVTPSGVGPDELGCLLVWLLAGDKPGQ